MGSRGDGTHAWRNGFVHAPYRSGSFRSFQAGTPKTTSAYSHVFVQNQSFTTIISIRGSVFTITSYAHFEFPRIEFPFTHPAVFVGVGMWVGPVNVFVPTLSGRS